MIKADINKEVVFNSYVSGAKSALDDMKKNSMKYISLLFLSDDGYLMVPDEDMSSHIRDNIDNASKEFNRCIVHIEKLRSEMRS